MSIFNRMLTNYSLVFFMVIFTVFEGLFGHLNTTIMEVNSVTTK